MIEVGRYDHLADFQCQLDVAPGQTLREAASQRGEYRISDPAPHRLGSPIRYRKAANPSEAPLRKHHPDWMER